MSFMRSAVAAVLFFAALSNAASANTAAPTPTPRRHWTINEIKAYFKRPHPAMNRLEAYLKKHVVLHRKDNRPAAVIMQTYLAENGTFRSDSDYLIQCGDGDSVVSEFRGGPQFKITYDSHDWGRALTDEEKTFGRSDDRKIYIDVKFKRMRYYDSNVGWIPWMKPNDTQYILLVHPDSSYDLVNLRAFDERYNICESPHKVAKIPANGANAGR